jgi:hypothetical protein
MKSRCQCLRMGATFVEGSSSIILCAYICIVLFVLVYVKYCIFHKYTFNLFHIIFDIYITLDEIFII